MKLLLIDRWVLIFTLVSATWLLSCHQRKKPHQLGKKGPSQHKAVKKERPPKLGVLKTIHVPLSNDSIKRQYDKAFLNLFSRVRKRALPEKRVSPFRKITVRAGADSKATYAIELDPSDQVFGLTVIPRSVQGEPIYPSLKRAGLNPSFFSASLLSLKAKQFDDGLFAAIELHTSSFSEGAKYSKQVFLKQLLEALLSSEKNRKHLSKALQQATTMLIAALQLSGEKLKIPPRLRAAAEKKKNAFLADPLRSKPIGSYTWSRDLMKIYRRDRLLQSSLGAAEARALASVLSEDQNLVTSYLELLSLTEQLTNPLVEPGLRPWITKDVASHRSRSDRASLFPPSRAHETDLFLKLGQKALSPEFNLADEIIRRIREKTLDLKPKPNSGFYDHQSWALEPRDSRALCHSADEPRGISCVL